MKARHSVRTFADQPVEDEKITSALEAARLAPSARNSQPWRYIVVKDRSMLERIADSGRLNSWVKKVPVLVIACADPKDDATVNGMDYFLLDVGISMEHLVLRATELGLGTCWLAGYDEVKVRAALGIPDNVRVVAMTPLGYPTEKPGLRDALTKTLARSKNRKSLEEIVRKEKW
ncbi:MAG: nitroreductase family protein [Methanomassiliicoccales archaeon]|nr:nitroreductase family protein [Methanomassiliicoccales archaeon]